MGFWHTGYMEFHEPTGLSWTFTPQPVLYTCTTCLRQFDELDKLLQHRFEAHPHRRPMLFVRGQELGATICRVTRAVAPLDFRADHATRARVNRGRVPLAALGDALAAFSQDRVTIELENDSVSASFKIDFSIAQPQDCKGVEECFESMVKMKRLDPRGIGAFVSASQQYGTAATYMDGICNYLYGVLAKERAPDSGLAFEDYREKFELAASALADFDRPLALMIRGLVAFQFNHFDDTLRYVAPGALHAAARRLQHLLSRGSEPPLSSANHSDFERALTDFVSDRIISWALASTDALRAQQAQLKDLLNADLVEYDRTKIRIILAEHSVAVGDVAEARKIARAMRNSVSTELWAESVMTRTAAE